MSNEINRSVHRFIRRFLRWVRKHLGLEQPSPSRTLEGISSCATLWRLPSSEAGVVDCWQICHRAAASDLVISLLSVARLREDVAEQRLYRRSTDPIRLVSRRSFRQDFSRYLESQGGLDARFISHIVVVAWKSRIPTPMEGSDRRRYLVRPVVAIPADLQGMSFAWTSGDRYASKMVELIARRVLKMEALSFRSWDEIVNSLDWIEWLDWYAKQFLGPSHVLQPAKTQNESGSKRSNFKP
ncbi:MAG TPA: hypothetical protein V6C78_14445 [Crinalium sp.]